MQLCSKLACTHAMSLLTCLLAGLPACRKYAWGSDEVDVINHTPKAWFYLGLTIVDSLDTLIISGGQRAYPTIEAQYAHHSLSWHRGLSAWM